MKFPSQIRTHCPHCNAHTTHKVQVVKRRERGSLSAGQRRFVRIMKGYRGFPRPNAKVVKQTKHIDIRLKCSQCNKMHTKTRSLIARKFELKR